MKNILKTVGLILASIMLISCGSTSGVRVTRESVTVMDHSGVGDVTTGENRVVRASNDFANVEIEYSSASKNQSETVKKVTNGILVLEGLKLGGEAVKEGGSAARALINRN